MVGRLVASRIGVGWSGADLVQRSEIDKIGRWSCVCVVHLEMVIIGKGDSECKFERLLAEKVSNAMIGCTKLQ